MSPKARIGLPSSRVGYASHGRQHIDGTGDQRMVKMSRLFGALAMVGLGVMAVSGPASAKTPQPKVIVTPNTNLTNGETVTVTAKHFEPGTQVFITECSKGVYGTTGQAGGEPYCTTNNYVAVTVNSDGTISATQYTVFTGPVGTSGQKCGTNKKTELCYMGLGDENGTPADSGLGTMMFVNPK